MVLVCSHGLINLRGWFQVVPVMSIVIAMLGEKLRELARKGQASVAGISAYLNEVGFSFGINFVHQNIGSKIETSHFLGSA
jgi:hypothetical protein